MSLRVITCGQPDDLETDDERAGEEHVLNVLQTHHISTQAGGHSRTLAHARLLQPNAALPLNKQGLRKVICKVKKTRASLEAIESVYRARGADFLRFALAKTGDSERAHDAVQEGFARAIRRRDTFRGSGSIEAWIGRCVINAAYDANRAATDGSVEEEASDALVVLDDISGTIREAALRLPQRQRDALFLRYYLDFDYRTIAETLEVEVGTVSATLHAARAALGHILQEAPR